MKHYPSITGKIVDIDIFAFAKLDGSNIRAEWSRKRGLDKFGSRKVLLGADHPFLGRAIETIRARYEEGLGKMFRDARIDAATCFFEFYGPKSFAGIHDPEDKFEATLFDIDVYRKGLLPPREFLRLVEDRVPFASLLYTGKPNSDFLRSVRDGTLEGMPFEGVVCKGAPTKNGYPPTLFKVKSAAWIEAVKARFTESELTDLL